MSNNFMFIICISFCLIFGLHLLDLPEKHKNEAAKPKGREVSRKAPAKVCFCFCYYVLFFLVKDFSRTHLGITFSFQPKKQTLVLNDDDDDDVLQLKERLAAYNVDSSPGQSAGKCYIIIFRYTIYYDLYTTQL